MMKLKFQITPEGKGLLRLGKELRSGKESLTILHKTASSITVEMNPDMTANEHKIAIECVLSGCKAKLVVDKTKEEPVPEFKKIEVPDIPLAEVDMPSVTTTGKLVWQSIFCKPKPVFDLKVWSESKDYRDYVYLPNCSANRGRRREDFNSNSMYTLIMLKAYQSMCLKENINPTVELKTGVTYKALSLTTFHAMDNCNEGERSAGLANSKLVDFDDSLYAKQYIEAIITLEDRDYDSEPAKKTVLSKSELILSGKTSHKYNQLFVKKFFQLVDEDFQDQFIGAFGTSVGDMQTRIYGLLRSMIVEGLILEDNLEQFQARLWHLGMRDSVDMVSHVYRRVLDEE